MGINLRYAKKFEEAFKDIPETIIPIEFEEWSPYYHQEEWREVIPLFVPGVLPNTYWISSMGRVYTNLRSPNYPNGGFMKPSINSKGYHQINLKSVDGNKIGIKITRLMMLHFRFIPGCYLMEVDHLDGNKDHNWIWNLEWVVPQENTHRAIKNHQRTISVYCGYYDGSNLLTDIQARELYLKARDGESLELLCNQYNTTIDYIDGLVDGSIRPYIRKQYNSQ